MAERAQDAAFHRKPQTFADSPLLLEISAYGGRRKPQKTTDFHRKPRIFAENRRKLQIGFRHLTKLGPPPLARPFLPAEAHKCREAILAAQLLRNCPHRRGNFRKNPHAHKNKIGISTPPPPSKKSPLLWGRGNLEAFERQFE